MLKNIFSFFKTGSDKDVFTDNKDEIRKIYEQKRWSVFLSITLGYAFFYVARLSLSVTKKPMLDEGILTNTEMGLMGSALLFTYAFGRLTNGFISDRSNIKKFMSIGILVSAFINLVLGFNNLFIFFLILWGINGWFQSMGSAPSMVSISQWFSNKERGTRYGIWNTSHSIGTGLTFIFTAWVVSSFGWRWGFWGPGLLCIVIGILMYIFLQDRPQTYGLPPVAEYKNDHTAIPSSTESVSAAQLEVIKNPAVWILGLSSACMYVTRYAINNWGILYLQETKAYSLVQAGTVLSAYPVLGVVGAIASGYVSDRFFNSKRNVPVLIFGIIQIISIILFLFAPGINPWIDAFYLSVFGFALGAMLCYLGGLMAVDICSKKAAGAAMGFIGIFSYLGAALQDFVSGYLIDKGASTVNNVTTYNFEMAAYFWVGASILSLILAVCVWNAKSKE
ncbi:MAG: MFS transporter [Cyanobacteriota bacterium]